jgi:2-polyprenyl-3-methyl-5-hydroxy-6-metoxy-1,4-benzoquinol methylase
MLLNDYDSKNESYYEYYRKDILPLVPKHVGKILEIGCGTGNTLAYLKANGYCDWVGGVELFPEAANEASSKLDKLYQGNIEEMELPIEHESIDIILCLDVLEHLINPEAVIKKLHQYLAPGGIIIASIPNVSHYSVIFPLIFKNKWEYQENGILDKTHIRFFVKQTAVNLMICSDLKLDTILSSIVFRKAIVVNAFTLGLFKSFLTWQYLIKVIK